MSKETENQTQRLFVAKDMTCTLTFSGPREFDSQDLQNLIAQLDMQRAMMDGEQLQVRASITSAPPTDRRPVKHVPKPKADTLSIPGPTPPPAAVAPQPARRQSTIGSIAARVMNGMPATPPATKTPEDLAKEVDDMERQRAAG